MKTKTVKRTYSKMLKFKIKQDEHVNIINLNKKFSKKIEIKRQNETTSYSEKKLIDRLEQKTENGAC